MLSGTDAVAIDEDELLNELEAIQQEEAQKVIEQFPSVPQSAQRLSPQASEQKERETRLEEPEAELA